MKKILFATITSFFLVSSYAQESDLSNAFDFWVGNWELTWDEGNGITGRGINNIVKILDDKVIQENFVGLEGRAKGFKGSSVSVFNPRAKSWHQAWVDNQGGYYDFVGEVDGDKKIFKTKMVEKDGKQLIQRMVFYDIKPTSLMWDWESSVDNGENWQLQWRIKYKKKE